jgi:hypothetical protein
MIGESAPYSRKTSKPLNIPIAFNCCASFIFDHAWL